MRIIARPKLCILYFDFQIGESVFDVEVRQDIREKTKVDVKVLDTFGNLITDERLLKIITDYSIQKYSIAYDGEDRSDFNNNQNSKPPEYRLDPPI